jgi:hypothetical protein
MHVFMSYSYRILRNNGSDCCLTGLRWGVSQLLVLSVDGMFLNHISASLLPIAEHDRFMLSRLAILWDGFDMDVFHK